MHAGFGRCWSKALGEQRQPITAGEEEEGGLLLPPPAPPWQLL